MGASFSAPTHRLLKTGQQVMETGLRPGALLLSSAIKGQRGKVSQIPWAPVVKDILIYINTALGIWGSILPILGGRAQDLLGPQRC